MANFKSYLFLFAAAAMTACSEDNTFVPEYTLTVEADTTINVNIDGSKTFQTIEGFGSSDAWSMDYVGRYWDNTSKEGIARLLFSSELDANGKPQGIGLSMWRVNLGGGTAEQGDESGINDNPERRAECFLNADGTYNWNKAPGQRYFMEKAKEYGVDNFVLFSNTAPVYYTKNGKGYSDSGAYSNLKDDCYDDFADFLASVAKHFADQGYGISYISPVNEPQYNWNSGQEGSGWQNSEVSRLVKELDSSLSGKGLADTRILVGEAGAWNYLYETAGDVGPERSNVISDFFDPSSENYIGNLSHVPAEICAHSYWLDTSWSQMQSTRGLAASAAQQYGLKLHQTEWSMMSENYEGISSYDAASYMDLALVMSQVMYNDLTVAGVSSWSYWTTCDRERWSQKSRFYLIRLQPQGGDYGALTEGGTYTASKNLWVLGNYSLFVRPGYKRVSVTLPVPESRMFASAYISPDNDRLVVVYTNMSDKSIKVNNTISVNGRTAETPMQYVTSETLNLQRSSSYEVSVIPSRSVATLVYDLK